MWCSQYLYLFSIGFFSEFIPIHLEGDIVFVAMFARGFLAVSIVALLFCYPLALIFRKKAFIVAIAMAFTIVIPQLPMLIHFNTNIYHSFVYVFAIYEFLTYMLMLVLFTRLVQNYLVRSNPAFKRDALKRAP